MVRKMVWTSFEESNPIYKEIERFYAEAAKQALDDGKRLKFSEFIREIVILGLEEYKKKKGKA